MKNIGRTNKRLNKERENVCPYCNKTITYSEEKEFKDERIYHQTCFKQKENLERLEYKNRKK